MPSPSKRSVPSSKVPSVNELCELLGFQNAPAKETNSFIEALRVWRKSYITSSGRPATDLLDWNCTEDQLDLEETAQGFLNKDVNGDTFWSPSRTWIDAPDLEFPEDRAMIVDFLKQLIWRQNRYAHNNALYSYPSNKGSESKERSKEKTTPAQHGKHIEAEPRRSLGLFERGPASPISSESNYQRAETLPKNGAAKRPAAEPVATHSLNSEGKSSRFTSDIFDVPDDSDYTEGFAIGRSPASKRRPFVSDDQESPRKKKKSRPAKPLRRTDRKRAIRTVPDVVPDDEVARLINDEIETQHLEYTFDSDVVPTIEDSGDELHSRKSTSLSRTLSDRPLYNPVFNKGRPAPVASMYTTPLDSHEKVAGTSSMFPENGRETQANQSTSYGRSDKANNPSSTTRHASPVSESLPIDANAPATADVASATHDKRQSTHSDNISNTKLDPLGDNLADAKGGERRISTTSETTPLPSPQHSQHSELPAQSESANMNSSKQLNSANQTLSELQTTNEQTPTNLTHISSLESEPQTSPTTTADIEVGTQKTIPKGSFSEAQGGGSSQLSPQILNPKPREKTQIPLWLITQEPLYTEEQWLDGRFMGTPLATFFEGISKETQRSDIEKIKLTLRGPASQTKVTVHKDADDAWAMAKKTFLEKLKEAKLQSRAKGRPDLVDFKILIEPFYAEGLFPGSSFDDLEDEFEF